MKVLPIDGETGVMANDADDWARCSHVALKHKASHPKAWLVESHNAPIRSALRRAEIQVIQEF